MKRRGPSIHFGVTPEDGARLRRYAAQENISIADFVRSVIGAYFVMVRKEPGLAQIKPGRPRKR